MVVVKVIQETGRFPHMGRVFKIKNDSNIQVVT